MPHKNTGCQPAALTAKPRAVLAAYRKLEQSRPGRTPTAREVAETLGISLRLVRWHLGQLRQLGELEPATEKTMDPFQWCGVDELESRLSLVQAATDRLGRRLTWDELGELLGSEADS